MNWPKIFSLAFSLFILLDPLGNVPIFISLLKKFSPQKQRRIIFRELSIALIIIICFNYLGDLLLTFLNVKQHTILVSGGIILFIIAIRMIFPTTSFYDEPESKLGSEPFIVPLATPLVAGPAVLAAIMLYSKQESLAVTIPAIIISWAASTLILLASSLLKRILGTRGLIATERLMGLILTLIAVQMFLEGIAGYAKTAL